MERTHDFYSALAERSIALETLPRQTALEILTSADIEVLTLLSAAYQVRKKFRGKEVSLHIINNAQNGHCSENCGYCAQARSSRADIEEYPLKSDAEILAEAGDAHAKRAACYCMVFAGRGPSASRVVHIARLIRRIKEQYPSLEVCVSAGLLDDGKAATLKEAGLDRLNHNLNTSEGNYPQVCTTHSYADRLNTLTSARRAQIRLCSGMIVGIGETPQDILEVAYALRELAVESIPVNFYIPIEGNALGPATNLSPEYCLRVLCLFRLLNPTAEIRAAAGRELHLRSLQVMALYAADSLFLEGYLNTKGDDRRRTLQMIKDAGFAVKSEDSTDELLKAADVSMKKRQDLRRFMPSP